MFQQKKTPALLLISIAILIACGRARATGIIHDTLQKLITIRNKKIAMVLAYNKKISITALDVNGQNIIGAADGIYTAVNIADTAISSLQLRAKPIITEHKNRLAISNIIYGNQHLLIQETWIFTTTDQSIQWDIERVFSKSVRVEENDVPVFNFNDMQTWDGAYQGYGGLAWFRLFDEQLCTYGVHTKSSGFWNSKTGNGLQVSVAAPGRNVAMRYSRTNANKLNFAITVSTAAMLPRLDSGTHRRRFIRNGTAVWAPFLVSKGKSHQQITLRYFDFNEYSGRGVLKGIDGAGVSAVLNTIARIGVIDSLHFGANSWHTPFGPICLHEQYVAQLGLAINDPNYLSGYQTCLDYFIAHAIKPTGRVYARWAYTNEDMMAGQVNKDGFYEAQWGILMDSNPDLVTNIAELYDLTGNKKWVSSHRLACEKVLDWILKTDHNNNGLVEMTNSSHAQKMSSDWIDIIWASYENAFVNAKLYHALIKWAAIERQLKQDLKAKYYGNFAARLKTSFNKPVKGGGFWDEEKKCYVYWLDKDKTIHGRNMVTPVNFMAIAYGICDNADRKKIILDTIEAQMQKENLFFWPLAMNGYAPGDGKESQYPFPSYENGDIFLSWGAVAVKAYAGYNPGIAIKYIKNVLNQYSKDGLAFQRYGRIKQDGLGDDILSGNSLAIAGLYQSVYGINPLYNRFYLDPHITAALGGTKLKYNFRNERLTITLDSGYYSVADNNFTISAGQDFGFYATKNKLSFFNRSAADACLQISSGQPLALAINHWNPGEMSWSQTVTGLNSKPLTELVRQLKPNLDYQVYVNGKHVKKIRANANGDAVFIHPVQTATEQITIRTAN